nr:helix-turn-helix transcriptional regulator [Achromobacter mucicolens]
MPTLAKPTPTTFGRRLREARLMAALTQEKLGVAIGLDEGTATVRIGRYETGVHEPSHSVIERLAEVLGVLPPFFHCRDDDLAEVILAWSKLTPANRFQITEFVRSLPVEQRRSS